MTTSNFHNADFAYFISGEDTSLLRTENSKEIILIRGKVFEDVVFSKDLKVAKEVWIEDCEFVNLEIEAGIFLDRVKIKKTKLRNLVISGGTFKEGLFINECNITDGIVFYRKKNCEFPKTSVSIENNTAKYISVANLDFDYINFSQNEVKSISVFNSLVYPETPDQAFKHLFSKVKYFNFSLNEKTKLTVEYQEIEKLSFTGTLSNAEVSFNMIRVQELSFQEFTKTGSGILNLSRIRPLDNHSAVIIRNSFLGNTSFYDCHFASFKTVSVANSHFIDLIYAHTTFPKKIVIADADKFSPSPYSVKEANIQLRETFRQLKLAASKQGDKLQETKFFRNEMVYLNKTLSIIAHFSTKLSLFFGLVSNNHKQNWLLPILWLFLINGGFVIMRFSSNIHNLHFNWITFFNLLNPAHRFTDLEVEKNFCSLLIDFSSRVINSFLIYQTITAFRKLA